MNKEQLKNSLHELSPTTDQKQQMLRQIRQAKYSAEEKKQMGRTKWLWRLSSALGLLVIVVGLWKLAPLMGPPPTADATMTMRADVAEEPAAAPEEAAAAPEEAAQIEMATESPVMYEFTSFDYELENTPWRAEKTPDYLPVFMPGPETVKDGETIEEPPSLKGDEYIASIVDFSVYQVINQREDRLSLAVTEQVPIISYEEAVERLLQQRDDIKKEQILAGYLGYTMPEEAGLIHPVYRFRIDRESFIEELFIEARQ